MNHQTAVYNWGCKRYNGVVTCVTWLPPLLSESSSNRAGKAKATAEGQGEKDILISLVLSDLRLHGVAHSLLSRWYCNLSWQQQQ